MMIEYDSMNRLKASIRHIANGIFWGLCLVNVDAATLFSDDFESGYNWTASNANLADVNTDTANSPVSSMYTRGGVVTSTSPAIDTSTAIQLQIDVWIRKGSNAFNNKPEAGEDLEFGYMNNGGTFVVLETFAGGGAAGQVFTRTYNLTSVADPAAFFATFQIRVRQTGGSGSNFDYWHIDDVIVTGSLASTGSCDFNSSGLARGIPGAYFDNINLTDPATGSRADGPVDFDWGMGGTGVPGFTAVNFFSVRWEGLLRITTTDTYRFQTVSDDGVRLYIDGVLVIDNWTDHSATTDTSGDVFLTAGQVYDIQLEFYERTVDAEIRLRWGRNGNGYSYTAIPAGPSPVLGEGLYYCTGPAPLAEWRLDESSWNGTAGEVTDETGSYNGTAVNGAQTDNTTPAVPGDPGTCGYGTFDDAGGGSGDYIEISGFPDQTTDFTITAWINTRDNTRQGQRIFADDENNSGGYAMSVGDGGTGRLRFYSRNVNNIILDSNSVITNDTWYFVAGVADIVNSQRTLYIYNTSGTLIDTVSDTFTGTWGSDAGPASIGGETNSGETGNRFYGNLDEVRFYGSALSQTDIETILNETHACSVSVASTIYLSTLGTATLGGLTFEDGDLVEYDASTDTTTSPPYFDESAIPPGVPNMDIDAAHLLDINTLVFSTDQDETIDGFAYEDGDLIEYDLATDTFSEFFSEDFFSGGADIDALYIISHSATQSIFLISTDNTETIGGNSFNDGDVFQVIYDRIGGTVTTSLVLDESIYGTGVDVDALHLLDSGNYILSMDNNETIGGFAYEDGDLIEYDPVGGTFSEYLSEDLFSGNEDIDAVTQLPVAGGIDHYDIDISPAAGITCLPVTVTITAKDATNATIAHTTATTINLASSTGLGTWGTASVGAVSNVVAGAGTADYQFQNGQSTVDIEFNYPVLVGAAPESVNMNITSTPNETTGAAVAAEDDPSVDFYTAALIYNNVTAGNNTIPTQISGKDSDTSVGAATLNIQAVRASDDDPSVCQSIFSNAAVVGIDLGAECKNPNQCAGNQLNISNPNIPAGVDIPTSNDDGGAQTVAAYSATPVNLQFGPNSDATIVLNYPDAGSLQLHARYELLLDDGSPSGEYAIGISNDFVVKPAGLCVESTDTDSDCVSADGTCTKFRKAGSVDAENFFNLTVRGVTWETAGESNTQFCTGTNVTTPNFQLNTIALAHTKIAPVGAGTQNGSLGVNSVDIVAADNGSNTESSQSITEVGVFTVTATPPLYQGQTIAASTSANIGRFYPDRFSVIMQNTPAFADACTGFTYQDQPFYYNDTPSAEAPVLEITALNSNGVTTNNYGGSFWKLTGGTLDRDYSDGSTSAATLSPSTTQSGGFTLGGETDFDGIGTFTLTAGSSGDEFMYQKAVPIDTPEEPFDADVDVNFLAAGFQDTDHTGPNPVCNDLTNDGTCDAFTYAMIQGTELRWGRLVVGNAFGSELLPLPVPLTAQYFSGGLFQTNTLDNCTTYQSGDASLAEVSAADNLVPGDTTVSSPVASTTLVNGVSATGNHLTVDAPGAGKTGSLDLMLDLSAATGSDQEWLRFDGNDPAGRISFGVYNGPDEFIYMREPWN